jgi:hypothetical protein
MIVSKRSGVALFSLALVFAQGSSGRADPEECADAARQYRSALSDISDSLRAYTNCLSDSRGHDDCSVEFSRLRSDQDDFESAVSSYQLECN